MLTKRLPFTNLLRKDDAMIDWIAHLASSLLKRMDSGVCDN